MPKFLVKATQDTLFKQQPVDSTKLSPEQYIAISKGNSFALEDVKGHLKVNHAELRLSQPLSIGSPIYCYLGHVEIYDISGKERVQFDEVDTIDIPAKPPSSNSSKTPIKLPGYASVFYLENPITPNSPLTWGEMLHGGSRIPKDKAHVDNMVALSKALTPYRIKLSKPFIVTSGYRPEPFNSRVGGAKFSTHLTGKGVDIKVAGMSRRQLANFFTNWNGGLGIYNNQGDIIHLDIDNKRRWGI